MLQNCNFIQGKRIVRRKNRGKVMHQTQILKEQVTTQQKDLRKLQKEKRSFLTEKSTLNKQIVELQEERRKLKAHLAKLKDEQKSVLLKHKTALNELVQRLNSESEKRQALDQKYKSQQEEIQKLKNNNVSLKEHTKLLEDNQRLSGREAHLKEQMKNLQFEVQKFQQNAKQGEKNLNTSIETLETQLKDEHSKRLEAEASNRKLYQRIETIMEQQSQLQKVSFEFERLVRENSNKNDENFELTRKFETMTAENHEMRKDKMEMEKKLADKDAEFERDRDVLNREKAELEQKLKSKSNELKEREVAIEEVKQKVASETSAMRKQQSMQEKNLHRMQQRETQLKSQLENRKAECILLNSELERLRGENEIKQKEITDKSAEVREMSLHVRQLNDQMNKQDGASTKWNSKFEKYEKQLQELNNQLTVSERNLHQKTIERDNLLKRVDEYDEKIQVYETKRAKYKEDQISRNEQKEMRDKELVQYQLDLAKAKEKINILVSQQNKFSEYSGELRNLEREKTNLENETRRQQLKIKELTEKLEHFDELKTELEEFKIQLTKEKYSRTQAESHASRFDTLNREMLELKQKIGSYESLIENKGVEISRLETLLEETKGQNKNLEQHKHELELEVKSQIRANNTLNIQLKTQTDIENALALSESTKLDLSDKVSQLNEDLINLKAEKIQYQDKCNLLDKQNDGLNDLIITYKENNQKLLFEKEKLSDRFGDQLASKNNEIERLVAELSQFQEDTKKGSETNQKEIRESRQEISTLRVTCEQQSREIARYQEELKTVTNLKEMNRELHLKGQRMEGELESMKSASSDVHEHKKILDEKLSDSLVKIGHLEQKQENLQTQLQLKITELKERNGEYKILLEKFQTLQQGIDGEHRELNARSQNFELLQVSNLEQAELIGTMKNENKLMNEQVENLRKEAIAQEHTLQQTIEELRTQNTDLQTDVHQLSTAKQAQMKDNEVLREKVKEYENATMANEGELSRLNALVEKQYGDICKEKDNNLHNELEIAKLKVEKGNLIREVELAKDLEEEKKELYGQIQAKEVNELKMKHEMKALIKETKLQEEQILAAEELRAKLTAVQIEKNVYQSKIESLEEKKALYAEAKADEINKLKQVIEQLKETNEETLASTREQREKYHALKTDNEVTLSKIGFLEKDKQELTRSYEEKINLLNTRMEDIKMVSQKHEQAKADSEKEKKSIVSELWKVKDSFNNANSQKKALQKELNNLKTEKGELTTTNGQLKQLYDQVVTSRTMLQSEMTHLSVKSEEEAKALQNQIEVLEETISAQKEARARRDEEIDELKENVTQLQERNTMIKEQRDQYLEQLDEVSALKQQMLQEEMDTEIVRRQNMDLTERITELVEERDRAMKNQDQDRQDMKELRARLEKSEQESFGAKSEVEVLKVENANLDKRTRQFEKMEGVFDEEKKENVALKTLLETSKNDLERTRSEFESAKAELQYNKVRVQSLESENEDLKSITTEHQANSIALETLKAQKQRLEQQLGEAQKNLQTSRTELALEHERFQKVESELHMLEQHQMNMISPAALLNAEAGSAPTKPSAMGPGGDVVDDGAATSEQQRLQEMLSRISMTGAELQKQQEEFHRFMSNDTLGSFTHE